MIPATYFRALLLASLGAVVPAASNAQRQTTEIPGEVAWEYARRLGFEFYPEALTGEKVSSPRDGKETTLTGTRSGALGTQTIGIAQVVNGRPSVMAGQRLTTFTLFGGRALNYGWTIKSVEVSGDFTYVTQPQTATSDPKFRIQVKPGGSATVRKMVLNGPLGAHFQEAFEVPSGPAPATPIAIRDYVVSGADAWNAARKYGFTFRPILKGTAVAGAASDDLRISGAPDGVSTSLEAIKDNRTECAPGSPGFCIIGVIASGKLAVAAPERELQENKVAFEMFGTRKLAANWKVKSVLASNSVFQRQAGVGTSDLSFVIVLTSRPNQAANAVIQSIRLTGPATAASFEDAFR